MTDSAALVLCAAGSSAITTAWHVLALPAIERERERARERARCAHVWGDPFEVMPSWHGRGERFYKRRCDRCGAQLDVNADGTPYVPRNLRDDK
jgi:hypothetical protein